MAQYEKLINLSLLNQFLTKAKTIFAPKITASGILKGDGNGNVSAATAGTDYGTYSKPSSGIPKTDLASDVQMSLGKADTALQQHQSLAAYRTAAAQDLIDAGKEASGLGLTGASVGDLVRVNAVDANGKPTSWKKVALNEIKCNKNLLDNWYFVGGGSQLGDGVFPINQRGQTTYSGAMYGIDRWYSSVSNLVMEILPDYISIDFNITGAPFRQMCSSAIGLAGKTVTFSILAKGENIRIAISAYNGNSFSKHFIQKEFAGDANTFKIYSITAVLNNLLSTESLYVQMYSTTEDSSPILYKAVKLELGSEQTLAHNEGTKQNPVWVLNEIPDYGEELAKCQLYFERLKKQWGYIGIGHAETSSRGVVLGSCHPKMLGINSGDTNVLTGNAYILDSVNQGTSLATSSMTQFNVFPSGSFSANFFVNGSQLVADRPCRLQFRDSTSYIDISCEP